jgi:chemotaxis protein CheD
MNVMVGIAEAVMSRRAADVLIAHSLGSCIGVALYDAPMKLGGLLHFQLPTSGADAERGRERPFMFADTGISRLLQRMEALGGERRRMRVDIAGGAKMWNDHGLFDIGRRNHAAIRKVLWQLGMFIKAEHIGGSAPRTMQLKIFDGTVTVKCNNQVITL